LFSGDEKSKASIFYFVNPERVSSLSIAYSVRAMTNPDARVEFTPKHRKVEVPSFAKIDISRTEKILKWNPNMDLTEGLKQTIEWFRSEKPEKERLAAEEFRSRSDENEWEDDQSEEEQNKEKEMNVPEFGEVSSSDITIKDMVRSAQDTGGEGPSVEEDGEAKKESQEKKSDKKEKKGWVSVSSGKGVPTLQGLRRSWIKIPKLTALEWVIIVLGGIGFFLLPLLISILFSWRSVVAMRNFDFDRAANLSRRATSFYDMYRMPAFLVRQQDSFLTIYDLLETMTYGAEVLDDLNQIAVPFVPTWEQITNSWGSKMNSQAELPQGTVTKEDITLQVRESLLHSSDLKTDFTILKNKVLEVDEDNIPNMFRDDFRNIKEVVWLLGPGVHVVDSLLNQTPTLLGFDQPQRYVVLLQNNTEIRSTGGFIGSYAAITLDKGQVVDFKIDDIYNPDGLLEMHNDPQVPVVLKEEMGVEYLGIRDSNWWSDFSQSAEVFTSLYERATGENINGVIAVNLGLIEKLLAETGDVYMPLYDETVTSENVFERAQYHSEVGFEPGSTQKKDFLGNLGAALIQKFIVDKESFGLGMAQMSIFGLADRDVMVYSDSPVIQNIWEGTGWGGLVLQPEILFTGPRREFSDYLRVIDNNLGGNKANYWINRSSNYTIDVDREGKLSSRLEITWEHTGKSASWPNGDYRNYVRIYLPDGSGIKKIEPELESQSVSFEGEQIVIAGLVDVPIDTVKTIKIHYDLPVELNIVQSNPYKLIWENQPGMNEEVKLNVNLPSFLSSPDQVEYSQQLGRPSFFEVKFTGTGTIKGGG